MSFAYNDGGRHEAGFKGDTGDCVVRALAIASGRPYREVYDLAQETLKREFPILWKKGQVNARTGLKKPIYQPMIESFGFSWTPTMKIGSGCTVHLKADELPGGRLIVQVTSHLVAVIDGVIHDTHDPSRQGTRCVYGYWSKT